jgi:hypothetical protein
VASAACTTTRPACGSKVQQAGNWRFRFHCQQKKEEEEKELDGVADMIVTVRLAVRGRVRGVNV